MLYLNLAFVGLLIIASRMVPSIASSRCLLNVHTQIMLKLAVNGENKDATYDNVIIG